MSVGYSRSDYSDDLGCRPLSPAPEDAAVVPLQDVGVLTPQRQYTLASTALPSSVLLSGPSDFDCIPDELLLRIMVFLKKPRDLAECAMACKRLRRVVCDSSLWRIMRMRPSMYSTEKLQHALDRSPCVLKLSSCLITPPPSSDRIDLGGSATAVRQLDLSNTTMMSFAPLLLRCPSLTTINLAFSNVTDVDLNVLASHCPNITALNLSTCLQLTSAGVVAVLQQCHKLDCLDVSWLSTSRVTIDGYSEICSQVRNLRCISLGGAQARVADEGLGPSHACYLC